MIPAKTIEELILKHSKLEKDLSSGSLDNKLFAEKSKEYSDVNEVIENAKILFKHINDSKHLEGDNEGKNIIIRGLNRQCLIAACVFNGATLQNIPLSPKEIGEIFEI